MKIYAIQNSGVEHNELLGFYLSKELAEKDMDFIAKHDVTRSRTWQERWIKIGECWYEQHRSKRYKKKWPKWDSPRRTKKNGWIHGRMYVATYDIREFSLAELMSAAREWQRGDNPIYCSLHSRLKMAPKYLSYPAHGVGLKCIDRSCDQTIDANNPILGIIHATYISNRTQAAEARRLRSVRKA